MRTIKEILRLKIDLGLSSRRIATSLKISRSTVGEYLDRFHESGLSREEIFSMESEDLREKLLVIPIDKRRKNKYPPPDWEDVFREVKKKQKT
jgi:transposase